MFLAWHPPLNQCRISNNGFSPQLNVLHWHLVDSQSSPMEYFKNPLFLVTQYGAYDKTKIYRQDRIKELVAYANFKGDMTSLGVILQ